MVALPQIICLVAKLHSSQLRLLQLLSSTIDNPLTIREIQIELNISSPSVVHHHIEQLEKKGYLKRNPSNPRDYHILSEPERQVAYLNLYGMAQCGPNGSILDGSPIDKIPIASRLIRFPVEEAFLVEARGDSMAPRISPGDLVIAQKRNTAGHGDLVVCVNDSTVLIKKIIFDNRKIILHSENPLFSPFIANEDISIQGIVRGIIQQFG